MVKYAWGGVFLLSHVSAFSRFVGSVPNMLNVVTNGERVRGLGHNFNLPAVFNRADQANPFGIAFENAVEAVGQDLAWQEICALDSDGDGIPNGIELCDPNCEFNPAVDNTDPECINGAVLSHPGLDEGLEVIFAEIDNTALKFHGWLMILAWCVAAPYGILRAVVSKRGPSLAWYLDHKIAMTICLALNILSMIIIISDLGTEPLSRGFDDLGGNDAASHVVAGLFVVLIAIVQPISGIFRVHLPPKGEKKGFFRLLWEFQHQFTGRVGIILAFFAIYKGLPLVYIDGGEELGQFLMAILGIVGISAVIFVAFFRHVAYTEVVSTTAELEKRYEEKEKTKAQPQGNADNEEVREDEVDVEANEQAEEEAAKQVDQEDEPDEENELPTAIVVDEKVNEEDLKE